MGDKSGLPTVIQGEDMEKIADDRSNHLRKNNVLKCLEETRHKYNEKKSQSSIMRERIKRTFKREQ